MRSGVGLKIFETGGMGEQAKLGAFPSFAGEKRIRLSIPRFVR